MSVRVYAILFGIIFLAIGILGFVPPLSTNGYLLNMFTNNLFHNSFHIFTGIIALLAAFSEYYSRMYFKVFGVIYLFLTVLSLMLGNNLVYMHLTNWDNIFHIILGAFAVYLGFGRPKNDGSETKTKVLPD